MKRASRFFLLLSLLSPAVLAQSKFPPSQRGLNGFLLGEDAAPIAAGFDTLLKDQRYNDGWTDRVYSLDSAGTSYMVFGFSDSSDDCMSIQITGKSKTPMHPFLGLRLGDAREKVIATLGTPSQIRHLQRHAMSFLHYDNRNYSVELDSIGRLWSIRILGYEGFAGVPPDSVPDLSTTFAALRSGDPDMILEALAPDVELIANDTAYSFMGAPLDVVSNRATRFSQLLYAGPSSLAALDESQIRAAVLDPQSSDDAAHVLRYIFPDNSPVKDVVFVVHAGEWRIWDARFSR
jgi:hypothetical protein